MDPPTHALHPGGFVGATVTTFSVASVAPEMGGIYLILISIVGGMIANVLVGLVNRYIASRFPFPGERQEKKS